MPASPTWKGYSALFEAADSGQYELSETITYTQIRYGLYTDCVAALVYKGTVGSGALATYLVKSCTVTKSRGNVGKMVTVWEQATYGGGAVLPADEFSLTPNDQNPATEKNPAFSNCFADTGRYKVGGSTGTTKDHKTLLSWVRQAGLLADKDDSDIAWNALIGFVTTPAGTKFDEALVLADFLRKGVQNYYSAGFTYTYTQYFASLPSVSAGGSVGAPGGTLGATIAALSLSCLRQGDDLQFSSGVYRRTQVWLCAKRLTWDSILYP